MTLANFVETWHSLGSGIKNVEGILRGGGQLLLTAPGQRTQNDLFMESVLGAIGVLGRPSTPRAKSSSTADDFPTALMI